MAERPGPPPRFEPVREECLRIAELPFLTRVNLRADPGSRAAGDIGAALGASLPTEPGTYVTSGVDVLWLGPDEWLVVGEPGAERDLPARLRAAAGTGHVAVTDVSAQWTTLVLAGPRARDVLAHGCSLDLHPRLFGPGRCAQTMLARAQVLLAAHGGEEFRVSVRPSYAGYLADWLLDAAAEHLSGRPG
ncbi:MULTISPECIES: sarcosine oxidase subunit gamma [Streptosporangium]|uniref:Sarcosine oxidase subunit gamma n=1 Tax=Streptosporangium brasiliense TaxID=47480 RepID=A0ABT9RLC8_9ACTN|nr:sarcosine oxidase subunit gamma family protein [Streptosporangium brasiliense]MDP9870103.1 sarcosine oxidase subunit gamma [Streptosporangium brasiliense]